MWARAAVAALLGLVCVTFNASSDSPNWRLVNPKSQPRLCVTSSEKICELYDPIKGDTVIRVREKYALLLGGNGVLEGVVSEGFFLFSINLHVGANVDAFPVEDGRRWNRKPQVALKNYFIDERGCTTKIFDRNGWPYPFDPKRLVLFPAFISPSHDFNNSQYWQFYPYCSFRTEVSRVSRSYGGFGLSTSMVERLLHFSRLSGRILSGMTKSFRSYAP